MDELPWSEDEMNRQTFPMYDSFCREEEEYYDKEAEEEALADLRREC